MFHKINHPRRILVRIKQGIQCLIIIIIITGFMFELALRVISKVPTSSSSGLYFIQRAASGAINPTSRQDLFWENIFARNYESKYKGASDFNVLIGKGLFVSHPTRGWTPRPGAHVNSFGYHYTINNRGERSPTEYTSDANRFSVLIVGDSFTFGTEAHDEFIWPNLLRSLDPELNIVNLAVAGYGTDQMLVTLSEEIDYYKPNLVIVAVIPDDLGRALLRFRDFKKPKFKIIQDELAISNVPIGSEDVVYQEVVKDLQPPPPPSIYKTLNLFRALKLRKEVSAGDTEVPRLNQKLFEKMVQTTRLHNADFLMIQMERDYSPASSFLKSISEKENVNYFDCSGSFPKESLVNLGHHYFPEEAKLISKVILDKIHGLTSFQKWKNHNAPS